MRAGQPVRGKGSKMNEVTIYKMYASRIGAERYIAKHFTNRTDITIYEISGNFYVVGE